MRKILATLLFLFAVTVAFAQQKVTGSVIDENGEPLIGATVKAKGSADGIVTDLNGHYTFNFGKDVKFLEVSYIGYKTQYVPIKNGKADVQLKPDAKMLDETVVIGYGSVKKGDVTNAVAKVKADELEDRPVGNIANALQGELAGVDIQSTSGAPGSSVQIKVRGATSINENASSNPLYVVDGVPLDDDFDLNQLNPQDIESIEVLKDASSSAIYGSRGANGVIIISSKKGDNDGKIRVDASANFAVSTPERYIDIMTPQEWMAWRQKSNDNSYLFTYGNRGAQAGDSYVEQLAVTNGSAGTSSVSDPRWKMPGYGGL